MLIAHHFWLVVPVQPKLRHYPHVDRELEDRAADELDWAVDAEVVHQLIEVAPSPHRDQQKCQAVRALLLEIQEQLRQAKECLDEARKYS